MKLCIVLIAFALVACSFVSPLEQDHEGKTNQLIFKFKIDQNSHNYINYVAILGELVLSRMRRVTCDLLSVSTPIGSLNHAACAGHCLQKGYKGGRCIDGVCNCRR